MIHATVHKVLRRHLGPKAPSQGPPIVVGADAYDTVCAEVRARLGAMEGVDFNPDELRPTRADKWSITIRVRDASEQSSWRAYVPLSIWRGPAGELRLDALDWGGQDRGYVLHDFDLLVPIVRELHAEGEAAALRAKKRGKLQNLKELALRAAIDAFAREDGMTYGVIRTGHRVRLLVRLSDDWILDVSGTLVQAEQTLKELRQLVAAARVCHDVGLSFHTSSASKRRYHRVTWVTPPKPEEGEP